MSEPKTAGASNPAPLTSRRRFLATTAALSLGYASTELRHSLHAAGSDRIRVGLIGCGQRGTGAAKNALDADPGVELVAMADLFADQLETSLASIKAHCPDRTVVSPERKFVGFDGCLNVIACCDVVLIACASKFHPYYLRAAIDAGKHVFVEKPHGIDPVGVRATQAACELAKQKGLSVLSGLHNRYDAAVRETIQRIHDGAIGEVVSIEVNFLRAPYVLVPRQPQWREIEFQYRNWYHFSWLSGDDVTQSLVHSLDKACWVLHESSPSSAHGLAGRSASFGEIYGDMFDHHAVVYEFPAGPKVYAFCRTQAGCHATVSDYVTGTKGKANLLSGKITGENNWSYGDPKRVHPQKLEQIEFFRGIRAGSPINSGHYMVNSTMTAVMGQIVCYNGLKLGWRKLAESDFHFPPLQCDFNTEPPTKPGPDGNYPLPKPGVTRMVAGV